MKINEFSGWSNEQKPSHNKLNHPSFEHYCSLGEGEAVTREYPASDPGLRFASPRPRPFTGDEYYRQHQTQLQQSDLHFDATPIRPHQMQQVLADEQTLFASAQSEQTTDYSVQSKTLNKLIPTGEQAHSYDEKLTPIIKELEQAIEQTGLPQTSMNNRLNTETETLKASTQKPEAMTSNTFQFKNNQLFIDGKQAELTLNLHAFNKQEQKNLINLLQNHLRQKGLILRQLIINGVNHD